MWPVNLRSCGFHTKVFLSKHTKKNYKAFCIILSSMDQKLFDCLRQFPFLEQTHKKRNITKSQLDRPRIITCPRTLVTFKLVGSLPVNSHTLAVNQGLGRAPAKADKLRITKHRIQVLQQPRFGLRVWKCNKTFCLSASSSSCITNCLTIR